MKTLIIRTDKLGDFYLTLPYIRSLQRKYGKENIDIVISGDIYDHFKNKDYLFNKIFSFQQKNLINKILLIFKLRNFFYDQVIIFDGKDRSIILSYLLKCAKKIFVIEKRKLNFIFRLFLNKKNIFTVYDDRKENYSSLFSNLISSLNVKFAESDYKFLKYENLNHLETKCPSINNLTPYTLLHLDEKWFSNLYINKFADMTPSYGDFLLFIKKFISSKNQNLIITTGIKKISFIDGLKMKFFTKINENFYEFNHINFKAILLLNSSIKDLETLSMNSNNIITCNGPLTQIAQSLNINIIDILENDMEEWYDRHIYNKKKYHRLFRKKFNDVYKEILFNLR